jgi:hypothetical protein
MRHSSGRINFIDEVADLIATGQLVIDDIEAAARHRRHRRPHPHPHRLPRNLYNNTERCLSLTPVSVPSDLLLLERKLVLLSSAPSSKLTNSSRRPTLWSK